MDERKFMSNVRMSFLEANILSITLVDGSDFQTRPFDSVVCLNGKFIAIEGKFQKNFGAFGIKHIRDSQILNLNAVTQGGGTAFIFLNLWIPHKENRLLIWEWKDFKRITDKGSIKKKTLEGMPHISGKKNRFSVIEILDTMFPNIATPKIK